MAVQDDCPYHQSVSFFRLIALSSIVLLFCGAIARATEGPPGMILIPSGEFRMGTDEAESMPNERPSHLVKLDSFWIDEHPVTNAEYRKFVEPTAYAPVAERPVDWEELKKQLPPETPKPPDEKLKPGSLVFTPPDHAVDLRDMSQWWTWTTGANWKHPGGPDSKINGDMSRRS